jgi:hypothetical protein
MHIRLTILTILLIGCNQSIKEKSDISITEITKTSDSTEFNSLEHNSPKIIADDRIDLNKELEDKLNTHLITYSNGVLDLCCYQLLNITNKINFSKFSKTEEKYDSEGQIETVEVLKYGNSFLKRYYNDYPGVNRIDIVSGHIEDNELISGSTIKLGIDKSEFIETYFQPSELTKSIDTLIIYEDEMGEANTIYIFENQKLKEINFDSAYDWIDKGIK